MKCFQTPFEDWKPLMGLKKYENIDENIWKIEKIDGQWLILGFTMKTHSSDALKSKHTFESL